MILHTEPQIAQLNYQRSLDEGDSVPQELSTQMVRYWSDFNRVFYHPRSIIQINDYKLGSSLMPFEKWENGEELFVSIDRDVDLLDRDVRVWAEECDQMQGMQIYTGGDDAWGGFAARYVESLRDEYGKMAIWAWGIEEESGNGQKATQLLRTLNAAKTVCEISTHASMYIPISVPATPLPQYVRLDRGSQWHSSALLSTAVETMTLPSRLKANAQKRGLLSDLEAALNINGNQRIAQLQCSILDSKTEIPRGSIVHGEQDDRVSSASKRTVLERESLEADTVNLDMSLSSHSHRSLCGSSNQHQTPEHLFGSVEEIRDIGGLPNDQESNANDDVRYAKKRRRFAGLAVIERFVVAYGLSWTVPSGSDRHPDTSALWAFPFLTASPAFCHRGIRPV